MGSGYKEFLDYYSIEGEYLGKMEKKQMHNQIMQEYFDKGSVSIRHKDVRLILMTSKGRLILQRRSKWKGSNPGMWDKTIGGHVCSGDVEDLAMLKECSEELGIPATIVSKENFEKACATTDLKILGMLTKLTSLDNFQSKRKLSDGREFVEPCITQFYIGYYDGPIRFIDSESCGIQVFTKEELLEEMENHKDLFTNDLIYIMEKFDKHIKPAPTYEPHVLND